MLIGQCRDEPLQSAETERRKDRDDATMQGSDDHTMQGPNDPTMQGLDSARTGWWRCKDWRFMDGKVLVRLNGARSGTT